jgi:hypothetical protein
MLRITTLLKRLHFRFANLPNACVTNRTEELRTWWLDLELYYLLPVMCKRLEIAGRVRRKLQVLHICLVVDEFRAAYMVCTTVHEMPLEIIVTSVALW